MEELLAAIANVDDEYDVIIRLRNAAWLDSTLSLRLEVSLPDSPTERWDVQCERELRHELNGGVSYSIELVGDHPLLWEFNCDSGSGYFYGAPANSEAAI